MAEVKTKKTPKPKKAPDIAELKEEEISVGIPVVESKPVEQDEDDFANWDEEDIPAKIIPKKEIAKNVSVKIIEKPDEQKQTKNQHIENAKVGQFVAFKNVDGRMFSAKLIEKLEGKFKVETRNGSIYFVEHSNVMWIKTGEKWPPGIYNAMRESSKR